MGERGFKSNRALLKLITLLLVCTVFSTIVFPEEVVLTRNSGLLEAPIHNNSSFSLENFRIPFQYGDIVAKHKAASNKFVINIQDAHCNYDAQRQISKLLKNIQDKYHINNINLEGASGPFVLDLFTYIDDKNIRKNVADHFMQTGDISGAEYYAINENKNTILWGVEDEDLYYRNLMVYRDFDRHRPKVERYISFLRKRLDKIIPSVFSEELAGIYFQGKAYASGEISFKEYLDSLCSYSKADGISIDKYPNIMELLKTSNIEAGLDFKEAESQREQIIAELEAGLSKNEKEILISKIIAYSQKQLSDGEFHDHLLKKVKHLGLNIERFSSFAGYTEYIKAFEKVDYSKLMEEINDLVAKLKKKNFTDQEQEKLDRLLSTLDRLEGIRDFCLTRQEYDRYLSDQTYSSLDAFRAFMNRHGELSDKDLTYINNLGQIDVLIKNTLDFYKYSFDRDKKFIKNLKYTSIGDKEVAILVTGGFHSDNLLELLGKENTSYLSIIPKFRNNDEYISPYYDLLSGKINKSYSGFSKVSAKIFNMAIASKLSPILAGHIWKEADVTAFEASVIIQELLVRNDFKKKYKLVEDFNKTSFYDVLDENGKSIVFGREGVPEEVISLKRIIAEAKSRKTGFKKEKQIVNDYLIEISEQTLKSLGKMYELHGKKFIVDGEKFVMNLETKKGVFPFKISLKRMSDGKEVGYKGFALVTGKPYKKIIGNIEGGDYSYTDEFSGLIRGGMLLIHEKVGEIKYRDRKLGRLLMTNFGKAFPEGYLYETEIKNKETLSDMFDGKSFSDTGVGSIMKEWKEVHWEFIDGLGQYHQDISDLPETRKDEFLDQAKVYGAFIPRKDLLENAVFRWPVDKDPLRSKVNGAWQDARMKAAKERVPVQKSLFDKLLGKGVLFSGMKSLIVGRFGLRSWHIYENLIAPLWEEAVFFLMIPSILVYYGGISSFTALAISRGIHIALHYFNDDEKDRFTAPVFISLLVVFNGVALESVYQGYFAASLGHIMVNTVIIPVLNHLFKKAGSNKLLGKGILGDEDDLIIKMAKSPDYESIKDPDWLIHKSAKKIKDQTYGWNIHISAGLKNAEDIFSLVQPILLKYKVPHIVVSGMSTLQRMLKEKKQHSRNIVGVFIDDLNVARQVFNEIDKEFLTAGFISSEEMLREQMLKNAKRVTGESGLISTNMDHIELYGDEIPDNRQEIYEMLHAEKNFESQSGTIIHGNGKVRKVLAGTPEYIRGENIHEIISENFYEALLNGKIKVISGKEFLIVNAIVNYDGKIMTFAGVQKDKDPWAQKYGPLFEVQLGVNVDIEAHERRLHIMHETEKTLPSKALKMLNGTVQEINREKKAKLLEFFNLWQERQVEYFFSFKAAMPEDKRGRLFFDRLRKLVDMKRGKVSKDLRVVMDSENKKIRKEINAEAYTRENRAVIIDMVPRLVERLISAYDIKKGYLFETVSVRNNVRKFCFKGIDIDRERIAFTYPGEKGVYEINLTELDHIRRCSGENFINDLKALMKKTNDPLSELADYMKEKNPTSGSYDTEPAIFRTKGVSLEDAIKEAEDRTRRAIINDYIEYLNDRTGLIPDGMIECEKTDGSKRVFIYKGVEAKAGLIVAPLDQEGDRVYIYDIEKVKAIRPVDHVQKNFIGKRITDLDVQYEDKQFTCRDAFGEKTLPIDLRKVDYDVNVLVDDVLKMELGPGVKETLLEMIELLKEVPPEFYNYDFLVEDLFGFTRSYEKDEILPEGVVAVWNKLFENNRLRAVGLFHEIGHYLLDKNLLEIRVENGKLIIYSQGKVIGHPVSIRNAHSFRQIAKAYIDPQYFEHYCLRALQIELFGKIDFELSAFIYENKLKSDIVPEEVMTETDPAEEFGSELEHVINFISNGKVSSQDIIRHIKYQKQKENGRITEKHIIYLNTGEEISFYLKKPDESYIEAFRIDLQYLSKEDGFTREAQQAGLSIASKVFTPEEKLPFLITRPASGERLRVRHIIDPGSKVPENIMYALGKLHGLGIMHCDLTYFLLDNEHGPACINFDHIYVGKDGSIQIIDFGEAAHIGEKFAGKNNFIEERDEVLESIMNLASLSRQKLLAAYEKGKAEIVERNKRKHQQQKVKAHGVIQDMFAVRAKAAIGDLRQKKVDIVVMPGSSDHMSSQKDIDSRLRRKLARDYGQETLAYNYVYSYEWRENLAFVMRNKVEKEFAHNKEKDPRILLYLPILPEEIGNIFEEKGLLYEFKDLKEHITVIAEENIPENGVIDEVMHIVLGKALLNYERFRKGDYGEYASYSKEALIRLESFLKVLVDNPESIDLKKDPEIINKILDGSVSLKIHRIDFSEITQWKNQQDAVLVSL